MLRNDVKWLSVREEPASGIAFEEMAEEEEDPAVRLQSADSSTYVTVEWMVVYSKTYRIPQLCFNVYGSSESFSRILFPDPFQAADDRY